MENRGDGGDLILMGGHYRGHNQNIGDFTDFRRLDVHRHQRDVQPAFVAGAVVGAEGNQQQQQEHIEQHHIVAVLRKELHIDGGNNGVQHHAHTGGNQLNNHITQKAHGIGGTGNNQTAEGCGNQAKGQQHHISRAEEGFCTLQNATHGIISREKIRHFIVP